MRIVFTTIALFTIISCSENTKQVKGLEYIFISRKGSMDTIYRETKYHFISDTMNIIIYRTIWNENDFKESFRFPKSENRIVNDTRLLDEKTIEFEGNNYIIYKYLRDDPNGDDEEMLYFYSPKFGVLIDKSAWWGNNDKLRYFGNEEDNRIVYYLTEMITNDEKEFFVGWK